MYQQSKYSCIFFADSIHHHHCDYGKMPWTRPVWSGDCHGYASHHEHHQSCHPAKVGGKVETEHAYIELEKIAGPDTGGVENEQHRTVYVAQGKASRPDVAQDSPHTGEDRKVTD